MNEDVNLGIKILEYSALISQARRHIDSVSVMVISRSIDGVMVITLTWNARDVGLIPTPGIIFPIFHLPTTLAAIEELFSKTR